MTDEFRLAKSTLDESGYDIVDSDGNRVAWGRGEWAMVAVRAINRYVDGAPDHPTPPAADERLSEIRALMRRWSVRRQVVPGGTPAPSTYLADAGLELLEIIDRLTAEREPISQAEFARFVVEAAEQRERAERLERELAASRAVIDALARRSPFFVTINHGDDDVETCQFCLEDGRHAPDCPWPPVEALAAHAAATDERAGGEGES